MSVKITLFLCIWNMTKLIYHCSIPSEVGSQIPGWVVFRIFDKICHPCYHFSSCIEEIQYPTHFKGCQMDTSERVISTNTSSFPVLDVLFHKRYFIGFCEKNLYCGQEYA